MLSELIGVLLRRVREAARAAGRRDVRARPDRRRAPRTPATSRSRGGVLHRTGDRPVPVGATRAGLGCAPCDGSGRSAGPACRTSCCRADDQVRRSSPAGPTASRARAMAAAGRTPGPTAVACGRALPRGRSTSPPESQAACTGLGTRGYWMSYFALRAAPLGAAPPELVTALFYGFAPRLVRPRGARHVEGGVAAAVPRRPPRGGRRGAAPAARGGRAAVARRGRGRRARPRGRARRADRRPAARRGERRPALAGAAAPRALARPDGAARAARRRSRRRPAHRRPGSRSSRWCCSPPTSRWTPTGCAPAAAGRRTSGRPRWSGWPTGGCWTASGALTAAGRALRAAVEERTDELADARGRGARRRRAARLVELVDPAGRGDHGRRRLHARQPDGAAAAGPASRRSARRAGSRAATADQTGRRRRSGRAPGPPRARMEGVSRPDPRQAAPTAALSPAMAGAVDLAAVKARSEAAAAGDGARPRCRARRRAPPAVGHRRHRGDVPGRGARAVARGARSSSTCGPSGAARASSSRRCWNDWPRPATGAWILAKVDVDANPRIAQAFGVQSIPMVVAVVGGQPVRRVQRRPARAAGPPVDRLAARRAARPDAGHRRGGEGRAAGGAVRPVEEPEDPRFTAAEDALERGDYAAAEAAYQADPRRRAGQRAGQGRAGAGPVPGPGRERRPVGDRRAPTPRPTTSTPSSPRPTPRSPWTGSKPPSPGWSPPSARTVGDDRDRAREHLVGLFELFPADDPRVTTARRALARALF